jgi:CheY-like chemotaxis protein
MKDNVQGVITNFVFIDDDPVNNLICKLTVEIVLKGMPSECFVNPKLAMEYFRNSYPGKDHDHTVLLLDINMPIMNGWEFLEAFDNLPVQTKQMIHIYILSSSVDHRDKDRSYANKNVTGFLVKPLSTKCIQKFSDDWILAMKATS